MSESGDNTPCIDSMVLPNGRFMLVLSNWPLGRADDAEATAEVFQKLAEKTGAANVLVLPHQVEVIDGFIEQALLPVAPLLDFGYPARPLPPDMT